MPTATLFGGMFPGTDPIPLPAPVWLFKALLDLTLSLHFVALYLFLGGLAAAIVLNLRGHQKTNAGQIESSGLMAGWLPVIMTYVINLGIPPLLFAQVLYGRALYTSSVLIGLYWIAVIPLLIFCYHLLYVSKARASEGRSFVWPGIGSLLSAWAIARIYSANMTLMLDPAVWNETYRADQSGSLFLNGPAAWTRWVYMLAAGAAGAGILAAWLTRRSETSDAARSVLRRTAVFTVIGGTLVSAAAGILASGSQSPAVHEACNMSNPVWTAAVAAWILGLVGLVAFAGILTQSEGRVSWKVAGIGTAELLLQTAGFVVARDLVRDASLGAYGFDVWDRRVSVNWSVLLLFFGLFVIGLGVVGWLGSIAYRSTPSKGDLE